MLMSFEWWWDQTRARERFQLKLGFNWRQKYTLSSGWNIFLLIFRYFVLNLFQELRSGMQSCLEGQREAPKVISTINLSNHGMFHSRPFFTLGYLPVHISGEVLLNHSPTFPQNSVILNMLETMRFLTLKRPPLPVPRWCIFLCLTGCYRGALHFRFRKKLGFCPNQPGFSREGWDIPD